MVINSLFSKDIHRNIQGVVKIGQDSTEVIKDELDEYVITKELNKHFDKFFEIYRKGTQTSTDKIGVWISGFFGSGKSHFLKILSYLLSNETYSGSKAVKYFENKILDSRILADMKLASDTSCDVILFNIDAKADSDSKSNKDAIVKVFMKVFNEMQGYCGSMPWIADLERQMDKDGVYEDFKHRFKELSGLEWVSSRDDFYFEEDNIVKALADTTKMSEESARSWYNKSEANYSLDVMQFANKVKDYIERKSKQLGKKHYVVFLCDEIGQYIGSNDNLMLNLQTVVENLGTECGGRAWVIATSQQDIDTITKVNRDNFSKIIGRFDTRLSLSSANVDEVIKKRLLAKTDIAKQELKLLYSEKSAIIKNLITFSQGTTTNKIYANEDEFVDVYPFVPYQFNLLQEVFTGIRTHGASGKHLSEGERSLLNAFQDASVQFSNLPVGTLVSFDAFYRTIETFLDHNIRTVFIRAEQNEDLIPDDISILKVLFMIKYIGDKLAPNIENITTLMIGSIDEDKIERQKKIDGSLRRLENAKLIIKNGDEYIFLTNDEQDINREISEIKIDINEIIDKTGDEIVNILFGLNKKHTYKDGYDFSFNIIIDDRARGNQKEEIGIKIITPYYMQREDKELVLLSTRENNLIVALPEDTSPFDEIKQALQIDTYIRKNSDKKETDVVEDIKNNKIREAKQRRDRCKSLLVDMLRKSEFYASNSRLDIKEKAPNERVRDGFNILIQSTYAKLSYITKPCLNVEDLRKILKESDNQVVLDGVLEKPNNLALDEMKFVITKKATGNLQTSLKTIIENFKKIPYGWSDLDIAGIVLMMFKEQEIKLELSGESLLVTNMAVVDYVTKRDYLDRVLVKLRLRVSQTLLSNAKNLIKELTGIVNVPSDEDGLMVKFKDICEDELKNKNDSLADLLVEYKNKKYPGKEVVLNGKKLFEDVIRIKDVVSFYNYLNTEKDTFLDYEEDIADVRKFFKTQRVMFDKAIDIVDIYQSNINYMSDSEIKDIVKDIENIIKLENPYTDIPKLPTLANDFKNRFLVLLEAESDTTKKDIEADMDIVRNEMMKRNLKERFGDRVQKSFAGLIERLETTNRINVVKGIGEESAMIRTKFFEQFVVEENRIKQEEIKIKNKDKDVAVVEPVAPTIKFKTIRVKALLSGNSQISNKDDIDKLIADIKTKLIEELEENTTINII